MHAFDGLEEYENRNSGTAVMPGPEVPDKVEGNGKPHGRLPEEVRIVADKVKGYEKHDCKGIAEEATALVNGDRQGDYGHPADDFSKTAAMWSAILGTTVEAWQVPLCMVCVKLARECNRPKRDNMVDAIGYIQTLEMVYERIPRE